MVLSIKKSDFLLFLVLILCALNYAGVSAQVTDFVMGDANESTFASGAQLATIAIDASKFTAGNMQFTSTITSGTAASYSRSDGIVSYKEVTVNENEFRDGGSFTVTYKDAAIMSDGTRRDLVIEFSGIRIASKNDIGSYVDTQRVFQAQQNGKPRVYGNSSAQIHFGYRIDSAKMYVAGVGSGDTFFFTMYGVNQQRNTGNGSQNFAKLNGAADNQNYSEQIQILSGNQSSIYIPSNSLMSRLETAGVFNGIFLANGGGNWTYQTGLAVVADAAGLVSKMWQDAPGSAATTDFYLMPDGITHTITSSSGTGGSIRTGKSGSGTDLDGGTYLGSGIPTSLFTSSAYAGQGPKMYDVPNGKPVTYTMTPEDGYLLDTLYINGASAAAEPHSDANGKIAYYTYTFPENTTVDQTIHVTWKQSVQIDFEKLWDDYNDVTGLRPDDISITLMGGNVSETVSVSGSDNWKHTFYDLPRYEANGTTEIDYIILENTVLDGYQEQTSHNVVTTQENPKIISYTITNTIEPVYVEITVIKEWDEDEHSASIEVNLLRDGTQVDSVTLPYNNEWAYTFTNKPKYDTSGNEYEYTVEESFIGSDAYDSEISEAPAEDVSGSDSNQKTFTITNTRKKTRVDVTKVWEDEDSQQRPSSIDLILKQNGTEYASAQINERVSWQHSFTDLPAYDFEGNAYDYTVEESFEGPYSSETEQTEIDGVISFTITNTLIEEKVDIDVVKVWADETDPTRPASISVKLLRNGTEVETAELKASEDWTHRFSELPKKDASGTEYVYTVEESFDGQDGYVSDTVKSDEVDGVISFTITNTLIEETVDIDVVKVWADETDPTRPASISVKLLRNGTEVEAAELKASEDWTHRFTELPKKDANRTEYVYTVEESFDGQDGYVSDTVKSDEVDGVVTFTVTNTLIEETVDIEVRKIWEDGDDPNRPQNIQIQLLRNGSAVNTTTLSARGNWTHTFHDLPRKDAEGNAYAYTVAENFAAMDSYTGSLEEDRDGNLLIFTFTNQLNVSAGFLPVRKIIEGSLPDPADTYTFRLEAKTAGAPMPEGAVNGVKTVTISSNASPRTAEFGTILFEDDGTFEYNISEENAAGASYTYDPSVYTVIWTVTDGKAVSSVQLNGNAYSGAEFIFTNVYELPEGWAEPQVLKQITGIQPNPEETYTFRLHPITPGAPMPEGTSSDGNKYITITGSRAAKFGPVQFTKDGSYEYRIREVKGTNTSAVYDETEYRTVVTVANGKITKRVWKNGTEIPFAHNTYEFTNVYPECNPEVEPIIRKVVRDGTPNPGDKFYFTLKATGKPDGVDTYPMPVFSDDETTKTISINGDDIVNDTPVSFGKISFPAPGEYAYEITEDKGGSSQYEYDETVYRVVWNVSAVTGGYVVEQHVYENGSPVNPEMITFRNRFLPDTPGDDIRVQKQITGFGTDEDEAFQFTLALVEAPQGLSSVPMPQAYENLTIRCAFENPSENKMTCTLKGGSLEFYFGWIDFPVNGTYIYEIREVFGNSSSYEYDTSVYTVRYTVSDGNVSKTVTKNGSAYSGSLIQFNNVNLKRPESEYARVDLEVSKTIVGEKYNEDDTFRITLEGISNTAGLAENPMPDDAVGNRKTITIKGEGTQNFGEIVFPAVGNYVYEVKEIHENLDRYEYDDVVYKVTWSVTARSTSSPLVAKMSVEMDGHPETSGNIGFENVKLPEPPAANPEVKKFLNGSTPDIDEYFRFVLKPVSKPEGVDEFPMPYDAEDGVKMVEIKGTGHAHFGGFHFPMDGEYVYEVWEEAGTNPDYDYDSSVYTIFYTVSGKEVEQKIRIGDSVVDDHSLVFENDYLVGSVVVHPRVKKVITRDPGRNDVFTFRLTAKSPDYPMPDGAVNGEIEIEIEGAGEKSFGAITFAEPGKYEYTITEVPSVPTYYFFDTSVYTVIYEVTESSTGEYKITTTILKDNVKVDTAKFVFTNVFGGTPDEDGDIPGKDSESSSSSVNVLPKTGFAPGRVTNLPKMRVEYSAYSQLRLMIPGLGVDTEILGVPFVDGDWDVSWLGDNVGWLQDTAWPGSQGAGNTVITGHSTNYLGYPGVFDKLLYLGYGAPVTITAFGEMFTYSVESVDVVYADTPQVLSQDVDFPMLTLITCKFYNEQTGQYDGRVVVKAKLFSVGKVH